MLNYQPPRHHPRRGLIRVHELARECGTSSKRVLEVLNQMGEFVKSASSTVEPSVAARVRANLCSTSRPPYRPGRTPGRPKRPKSFGRGGTPIEQIFSDQGDLDMARALGLDGVPQRRGRRVELTGMAKAIRDHFPQVRTDDEARHLATKWAGQMLTEKDAMAWWRAGLGPHDYSRVGELDRYGIRPEHLDLVVVGNSIRGRLRGGASVTWVAGLLRENGIIQ